MIRDYGREAQAAAEAHLEACFAALAELEEGDCSDPQWPDTAAPFCGCETCCVRETLHVAWPILLQAARAEVGER